MKKVVKYKDREFICYVSCPFSSMIEVSIWERKRPKWIIFKDSYQTSFVFLVDEDKNIIDYVEMSILKLIENEEEDKHLQEKWKDFENTLDNCLKL